MDLQYLIEFAELAKTLNFTKAAERLHMSQPTLSKHMASIEQDIGVKLFNRTSTKVTLTEEGFYIVGVADEVLDLVERARAHIEAKKLKKPIVIEGRFEDAVISELITATIEISKRNDLAPVVFNHTFEKAPLTLLVDGDIDVIVDMPPLGKHEKLDLVCQPIMTRPMSVVVDKDHHLADRSELRAADLKEETFMQLIWEHFEPGWNEIVELCLKNDFDPKRKPRPVRSLAEAFATPLDGSLLVIPGDTSETRHLSLSNRVSIPLVDEDARFTTCLLYRKDNEEKLLPFLDAVDEGLGFVENRPVIRINANNRHNR